MKLRHKKNPRYVQYLAVLPFYRSDCMAVLTDRLGESLATFCGDRQLDTTIRTGIPSDLYIPVRNVSLAGRILVQIGGWRQVLAAEVAILDLNPRSLSSWALTMGRRILQRRTLLWGHLDPRSGKNGSTVWLRERMRALADGTVLYGYDSVRRARSLNPSLPVWVAPNSLYRAGAMNAALSTTRSARAIYVGRLVRSKKVDLAVMALANPLASQVGLSLDIVGDGADEERLRALARKLGVLDRIVFHGSVTDSLTLHSLYSEAFCAVSPGYAGLSVTQSAGFGVPILVARDEPHAPEIELTHYDVVRFFESDDPNDMAKTLLNEFEHQERRDRGSIAARVRRAYSAEAMADGLVRALLDERQDLREDGWPDEK